MAKAITLDYLRRVSDGLEWAIPLIWWGDKLARAIDVLVRWGLATAAFLVFGLIRLLLLIPGFTFDTSEDDPT